MGLLHGAHILYSNVLPYVLLHCQSITLGIASSVFSSYSR